ncbi:hypothetical protein [Paucibacter sp. B2R-40]|uniref:hypothetical protein n=1 Tax=Paucibacter sp. B2R-40 TaxID=2893554 RepID=UPI0021E44F4B|nr:hypothetical protein [Paucibacter sp. B2R-40]
MGSPQPWLTLASRRAIVHLAVSPDASLLLACDAEGAVFVWQTEQAGLLAEFQCPAAVRQAAVLAEHVYVTVDGWRRGLLWQADEGGWMVAVPIASNGSDAVPFDAFAVAADARTLTLVSALDWLRWERTTNRVTAEHRPIEGERLAYPDGAFGVSADGSRIFLYWDELLVFDAATETLLSAGPRHFAANAAALDNAASKLLLGTPEGELIAVHPQDANGACLWRLQVSDLGLAQLMLGADGAVVGWIDEQGRFGLVDANNGLAIGVTTAP